MPPNPDRTVESRQLSSTLRMAQEWLLLFHLIYLSTSLSLKTGEKQFWEVPTIARMLKEIWLKDQVSLFMHIRLQCFQDHQTPAEKRRACGPVPPSLSQSNASDLEKKSRLLKPMWVQRLWENLHSRMQWRKNSSWMPQRVQVAEGLILQWLSSEMVGTELCKPTKRRI
jgi:hypothetical protein